MTTQINNNSMSTKDAAELRAAKRLPAPVPGVEVKVPLKLVPVYLQLHGITPKAYRSPVLLVKREEQGQA